MLVPAPLALAAQPHPIAFDSARCPAEQLSCGKQRPMLSNGSRRFVNDEMGLSVVFPKGLLVCIGRSGDAPRGFFAWFGLATNCNGGAPDRLPGYLRITTMWHDRETPRRIQDGCTPPSRAVTARLGGAKLTFGGNRSWVCQDKTRGAIELSVITLAGTTCKGIPSVEFRAFLGTNMRRLDADLTRFRTFLKAIRIGNDQVAC